MEAAGRNAAADQAVPSGVSFAAATAAALSPRMKAGFDVDSHVQGAGGGPRFSDNVGADRPDPLLAESEAAQVLAVAPGGQKDKLIVREEPAVQVEPGHMRLQGSFQGKATTSTHQLDLAVGLDMQVPSSVAAGAIKQMERSCSPLSNEPAGAASGTVPRGSSSIWANLHRFFSRDSGESKGFPAGTGKVEDPGIYREESAELIRELQASKAEITQLKPALEEKDREIALLRQGQVEQNQHIEKLQEVGQCFLQANAEFAAELDLHVEQNEHIEKLQEVGQSFMQANVEMAAELNLHEAELDGAMQESESHWEELRREHRERQSLEAAIDTVKGGMGTLQGQNGELKSLVSKLKAILSHLEGPALAAPSMATGGKGQPTAFAAPGADFPETALGEGDGLLVQLMERLDALSTQRSPDNVAQQLMSENLRLFLPEVRSLVLEHARTRAVAADLAADLAEGAVTSGQMAAKFAEARLNEDSFREELEFTSALVTEEAPQASPAPVVSTSYLAPERPDGEERELIIPVRVKSQSSLPVLATLREEHRALQEAYQNQLQEHAAVTSRFSQLEVYAERSQLERSQACETAQSLQQDEYELRSRVGRLGTEVAALQEVHERERLELLTELQIARNQASDWRNARSHASAEMQELAAWQATSASQEQAIIDLRAQLYESIEAASVARADADQLRLQLLDASAAALNEDVNVQAQLDATARQLTATEQRIATALRERDFAMKELHEERQRNLGGRATLLARRRQKREDPTLESCDIVEPQAPQLESSESSGNRAAPALLQGSDGVCLIRPIHRTDSSTTAPALLAPTWPEGHQQWPAGAGAVRQIGSGRASLLVSPNVQPDAQARVCAGGAVRVEGPSGYPAQRHPSVERSDLGSLSVSAPVRTEGQQQWSAGAGAVWQVGSASPSRHASPNQSRPPAERSEGANLSMSAPVRTQGYQQWSAGAGAVWQFGSASASRQASPNQRHASVERSEGGSFSVNPPVLTEGHQHLPASAVQQIGSATASRHASPNKQPDAQARVCSGGAVRVEGPSGYPAQRRPSERFEGGSLSASASSPTSLGVGSRVGTVIVRPPEMPASLSSTRFVPAAAQGNPSRSIHSSQGSLVIPRFTARAANAGSPERVPSQSVLGAPAAPVASMTPPVSGPVILRPRVISPDVPASSSPPFAWRPLSQKRVGFRETGCDQSASTGPSKYMVPNNNNLRKVPSFR